ncbi:MAG TPA: SRPBCC domain-containing protein [Bacteroidota bacterium]|nr:SRPBCC domain-containing protein [Bacteroidota bacterium]
MNNNTTPVIVERTFDAPIGRVWQAITDKQQMKQWYFDLAEFRAEVGFEFRFTGGTEEHQYLHICRITELVPGKKLTHSWRYDGFEGISFVTFELFDEGGRTRVKLTHSGLESFPASNPDFAKKNFEAGWTAIVGTSLKKYLTPELK